ncbi:MAG: hypothetical protein JO212_07170 [Acetobacteraceae bacterium]|nr:hypothetical protein [Acetobacteraceae bacterium]
MGCLRHAETPGQLSAEFAAEARVLIPSGYLPLRVAIMLVAEALFPDAQARSHMREQSSENDWTCLVLADTPDATRQAIEEAKRVLRQAFVDGVLPAFVLMEGGSDRKPEVPLSSWRSQRGALAMRAGVISWAPALGVRWSGPVFVRDGALTSWLATKLENKLPNKAATHTIAQETELKKWLMEQMKTARNTPRSKEKMMAEARAAEIHFSDRGFNRAYTEAAKEANAPAWIKSGRRKKSPH